MPDWCDRLAHEIVNDPQCRTEFAVAERIRQFMHPSAYQIAEGYHIIQVLARRADERKAGINDDPQGIEVRRTLKGLCG